MYFIGLYAHLWVSSYLFYLFERETADERSTKRDLPYIGSFSTCSQQPELGKGKARNQELNLSPTCMAGTQLLGPSAAAFPREHISNWNGEQSWDPSTPIWIMATLESTPILIVSFTNWSLAAILGLKKNPLVPFFQ